MIVLAYLLAGCGRDPALERLHDALAAYDRGRAAMDRHDWDAARRHFDRAARLDPNHPALFDWQALARERAGDIAGALRTYDAALARFPDDATLRYNRAALRARTGDLQGAASDLRRLYAHGGANPHEAGSDPDFAALSRDPSLAPLAPPPTLDVTVQRASGPVLLGEDWRLDLRVVSPRGEAVRVEAIGAPTGLLRHTRTVEDLLHRDAWTEARTLSVTWRAVHPGRATAGPWRFTAGTAVTTLDARSVEVVALSGRASTASEPGRDIAALAVPSTFFRGLDPPWIGRVGGRLAVVHASGQAVRVATAEGMAPPVERFEYRDGGQPIWDAELYDALGPARVRISEGTRVVASREVGP